MILDVDLIQDRITEVLGFAQHYLILIASWSAIISFRIASVANVNCGEGWKQDTIRTSVKIQDRTYK